MPKGKWAQGIVPRNFRWVIKEQIAVCERLGGYGQNHRRVRREEEIIWVKQQNFSCVVSLIRSPHNLHNYEEHDVPYRHRPFIGGEPSEYLGAIYGEMRDLTASGVTLLIHQEEVGDTISGLMAGYLLWTGYVPSGPKAISVSERLFERHLGPNARQIVSSAQDLVAIKNPA